ncbi:glycosyltransferase [Xylanimonas allomyrinae]|uniref:Glycosyltransferase n=1 Tax=Xylanimonas allomyrinae TaxID=2509459 RepID=A0A4P6ELC2_9MICO|nr:cellulose synthase catalytic subunit [Xylanimonas allomyrinae]QAY63046.1 glycosyltransferase [Xylanimonas allomyrinae]
MWKKALIAAAILAQAVYIVYRVGFTLPVRFGLVAMVFAVVLVVAEMSSVFQGLFEFFTFGRRNAVRKGPLADEDYPDVDIFITTHNESRGLIYKTLNGCTTLHYPDPAKVHIYLLDDTNRPEMRELAASFGVDYIGMDAGENPSKKAGNLNNALRHTASPLVVCLDSDMIPKSTFLDEVVPYFYETAHNTPEEVRAYVRELESNGHRYRVGYVQTPQDFYSLDLFQHNLFAEDIIPNDQDYFFKKVNEARSSMNSPIFCGSNAILSREALVSIGGLSTDSITEDLSSSIKLQKAGYVSKAISESYGYGLSPFTIDDLRSQRTRWSRGFVQAMRANKPFRSRLSFLAKLSYLDLYNYWMFVFRRVVFMVLPIVTVLLGVRVLDTDALHFVALWGGAYALYNVTLARTSDGTMGRFYSNLVETILAPYLVVGLAKELVGIREDRFVVTPKSAQSVNDTPSLRFTVLNWVTFVLTVAALVLNIVNIQGMPFVSQLIVGYWLLQNAVLLVYAISFTKTRPGMEDELTKWSITLPATVAVCGARFDATTHELNERHITVRSAQDLALAPGDLAALTVTDDRYSASLRVSYLHRSGDLHTFGIDESAETFNAELNQYLDILHDRDTTYKHTGGSRLAWAPNFLKNLRNILPAAPATARGADVRAARRAADLEATTVGALVVPRPRAAAGRRR